MSHIHLPDGILPAWLWLGGYAATVLALALLWRGGKATAEPRQFALLGIFAALMVLAMTFEVPPLSYHLNLTVVAGVVLGPRLSILAAFLANTLLAAMGHGGVTVVGLNTLVLSAEMLAGYAAFRLLMRAHLKMGRASFLAAVAGLASGTAISFGILAAGRPWVDQALQSARLSRGEALGPALSGAHLELGRLAILLFGIGAIGWILEGVLSAAALGYLQRVYPEVITREEQRP